ncbi:hypothetical protein V8B97DRAFT_372250 [Scleroderma yunnanense]
MANDQAKSAGPVAHEHPYPPTMTPYPQGFSATYPGYPVYIAQHPDANHAEGANGTAPAPPFMIPIAAAPGMLYPYPPGQPFPQFSQPAPPATNGQRPKRKQVKMACTNCANACKRCDEARPCERCVKYGIQESCIDGVRKERQKGIKRGPYKRKNKPAGGEGSFEATNGDSEWQGNGASSSNPTSSQAPTTVHAIPHYPPPAEGYFPYFFPPPGFIAPGHEGAPVPEGASSGTSQPPAMVQYYTMPPPGYFPYPPSGVFPPPQNGSQVPTIDPIDASRNSNQPAETATRRTGDAPTTGKKRSRAGKNTETKTKKAKAAVTVTSESSISGGTVGGNDRATDPGNNSPVDGNDA